MPTRSAEFLLIFLDDPRPIGRGSTWRCEAGVYMFPALLELFNGTRGR